MASEMIEVKSDETSQSDTPSQSQAHVEYNNNDSRRRYFLGAQGKALTAQVAVAGSIGFLLFGYDQGVLGVCQTSLL